MFLNQLLTLPFFFRKSAASFQIDSNKVLNSKTGFPLGEFFQCENLETDRSDVFAESEGATEYVASVRVKPPDFENFSFA